MPIRDQLEPATVITQVGNYPKNIVSLRGCIGSYKSISALNHGAPLVPGVYRCNPVTIYQVHASSIPMGKVSFYYDTHTYTASGDVAAQHAATKGYNGTGVNLLPQWSSSLAQAAINKAYSKLMKADLDLGVMLGELRETIEGLRNPLSALRNFLKKYPLPRDFLKYAQADRRGYRPGRDTLNMLSGSWLEWRYGIRPLLKDLNDVIEHIKAQSRVFSGKMRKRGAKTPKTDTVTWENSRLAIGDWQFLSSLWIRTEEFYSASVCFRMTEPLTWQESYGLDLSSIPGIAWELTRLSFVADWFISVGTWLDSLKALSPKIDVLGVSVTQRVTRTVDCRVLQAFGGPGMPARPCGTSTYRLILDYMKRSCVTPGFNTVTPVLNPKAFDLTRSLDALTLMWQHLPRK